MSDIVSKEKRSEMMSGIRGKNTRPEKAIRTGLHQRGFRYRIHVKGLPGKPDIVLPKYGAIINIHGCFWHAHECDLFRWPTSRVDFWRDKLMVNRRRDEIVTAQLRLAGWRIMIIWECCIRDKSPEAMDLVFTQVSNWLSSKTQYVELQG